MIPQENYQTTQDTVNTELMELEQVEGVTIYVKSEYPCKIININTHFEAIAVSVKLRYLEINIWNLCIPNQIDFTQNDIENNLNQIYPLFIITGDFNSHNFKWGSKNTDRRGKEIYKAFDKDNILILNSNEPTRINITNGQMSNIDLSLSNTSLA